MPIATKPDKRTQQAQAEQTCTLCHKPEDDLLVTCASIDCTNRVHSHCALRPEGTQLHFCSRECAASYFNR